ncbi:MAG: transcription-repair coupling factor [Nitrospirae bacterium]|nr:MAG: transcription-repair coupling factor [Nitrospirota bacterium]
MPPLRSILKKHIDLISQSLVESDRKRIFNIPIPHFALFLLSSKKIFVVVEDSAEAAAALYSDMIFFEEIVKKDAAFFYLPPLTDSESAGQRAKILSRISAEKGLNIITCSEACSTGLQITEALKRKLTLTKKMVLSRDILRDSLINLGYRNVGVVVEKGEFCERGWLFDLYPSTTDLPVRIEFFGDEIDLIRNFDIETQRSVEEIESIALFPADEPGPASNLIDEFMEDPCIEIFAAEGAMDFGEAKNRVTFISHMPFQGEGVDAGGLSIKGLGILPSERKSISDMPAALRKAEKTTVAVMQSRSQAERLKEIINDADMTASIAAAESIGDFEGTLCLTAGTLSGGFRLPGLLFLTDKEIFGERPAYRQLKKSKTSGLLLSVDDIKPGDFIVHKDHGIGRFIKLARRKTEDFEEDLISLEYSGGDLVYVPFQGISRLKRYSVAEGQIPVLDRLGSKRWQKTKQRVKEGVKEMADKLLKLYAERKVSRGFVFSEDTHMHKEFDEFFPYEETADQLNAVEEIKKHMTSDTPMDMLLCGDVGYGKTEVAMRAVFRTVYDGKQAAVLVPTTLLAEQHFKTFGTRFSGFPLNICRLDRFRSKAEVERCVSAASKGETDIVIGTHMLLNKRISFHNLGLLVIDEEHRFGVAQKEKLKELKKGVDVLSLTATPIPRTLHMSLSGIREMCTIETPPEERISIRSIVTAFSDKVIKEAIVRELHRNGQVFFVHNRIGDIESVCAYLKKIVPEASIAIAHGQMRESSVEKVMLDFFNKETDILLCTAIIGSGLDIPNANTILINRSDTFGLSDLYQLKGRVGRGNVQAYAYFLMPGEDIITHEAKKRLQAIQEMSYLGAGFRLAMRDMEIRGAGNLLGAEQSGHIHKVGFDMYIELLEKAVAELKGEEPKDEIEPQISLRISAFISEEYIPDISLRLSIYRRISSAASINALLELHDEIADRFGKLPAEASALIGIMRLKILAQKLYVSKISESSGKCKITFSANTGAGAPGPEGFTDNLMRTMLRMKAVSFLPDGFEFSTQKMGPPKLLDEIEQKLAYLCKMLFQAKV